MAGNGGGTVKVPDAGELTPKGRATRDRIVAAAADLMVGQGVAGTSLQEVQQAARGSGPQMYHYFGDRASLVQAVPALSGGGPQHRPQARCDTAVRAEQIRA